MAKPPRPTPLPLLAKINQIIVDLAALADTIEAERTPNPRADRRRICRENQATFGERLETFERTGEGENVISFPLRNPRR